MNRAVAHIGDLTTPISHRSSALEVPVAAEPIRVQAFNAPSDTGCPPVFGGVGGSESFLHNIAASVVSDVPIIRAVLDMCDLRVHVTHVYVMLTRDDEPRCSARGHRTSSCVVGPRHDF